MVNMVAGCHTEENGCSEKKIDITDSDSVCEYCSSTRPERENHVIKEDRRKIIQPPDEWLPITESRNGNSWTATFHLLCSGIGIQTLALPLALAYLGWFWGIMCLSVAFVWQLYTIWLLISLHESVPGTRYSRYLHLSIAAFGVKLGKVLTIFPVMYLSAGTCVMFIITAAIVSFLGAIMGVGYCTIIWVDIIATGRVAETVYDPPHTVTSEASRIQSILSALAIISLVFRGHNVVLEIQATMPSTPNRPSIMLMRKGVIASYFIISICFFPLAIVGYWTFGNEMPAKGGLIYSMVIFDNLERVYSSRTSNKCSKLSRIGIRIFFGGLTSFISVAFPFLPSLTFLGGIALPLTYGYPCFMWIAIKKPPKKSGSWWLNLGLGCSCIGLSLLVVVGSVWNLVTTGLDANFFHPR
nr:lysine histidine transporter-like 8 [Tanacetum cinerariifolium]